MSVQGRFLHKGHKVEAIYQLRINKCGGSTQWNMTQKILKNQTVHE